MAVTYHVSPSQAIARRRDDRHRDVVNAAADRPRHAHQVLSGVALSQLLKATASLIQLSRALVAAPEVNAELGKCTVEGDNSCK